MEVLHVAELCKAPITLENVDWGDNEKRKAVKPQSPTATLPCLTVEGGKISQSKAIENYLAETYKPELLGANPFEKAQVLQWVNFAMAEIYSCTTSLIYPLFGWKPACKEAMDEANKRMMDYIKVLEGHLNGKKYFVGEKMTLADVVMFFHLRYYFQYLWVDGKRKSILKNTTAWFSGIMDTPEAKKAYGRTLLCKNPLKAPVCEKKEEKKPEKKEKKPKNDEVEEEPKEEKKIDKLTLLPPSKMDLDAMKRAYLNNKDKEDAMNKFWEGYDPEGFSIWRLEYELPKGEGKVLYRTCNNRGFFLQKLDSFRRWAFAVHGVYGEPGNFVIRGCWLWRGTEVPDQLKENDYFEYITLKKLDPINKPEDKQLVHDYWTHLDENQEVEGLKAADVVFFN